MSAPRWNSGTRYAPGALVQPRTTLPVITSDLDNPDLEGSGGWTFPAESLSMINIVEGWAFSGTHAIYWGQDLFGEFTFTNTKVAQVSPGQKIIAKCRHRRETDNTGRQGTQLQLHWFDKDHVFLSRTDGWWLNSGKNGPWFELSVTGTAPANAMFVQLAVKGDNNDDGGNHGLAWDAFTWDYVYAGPPTGLIFKAVQVATGFSGSSEPAWPVILGEQVIDNQVIWEAVQVSRVEWEAKPILVSGASEPAFPTAIGATVADGTIAWKAVSRRIEDVRCPHSKVVAIAARKIFAADKDIVAYSATVNPLDWSTTEDAGYLPFGLQTYGAMPVAALGLYRGNLIAFNAMGFQMWQVDEDPANMALLDAIPIGSTYHDSIQPVSNDLMFLTTIGIRNVGIAGASTNLQAGDFGKAIDPLVRAALDEATENEVTPRGLYYPAQGQYWLFFGAEAFVCTINGPSEMNWSRYVFPGPIDNWTILNNDLYLRARIGEGEAVVWRVSEDAVGDDEGRPEEPALPEDWFWPDSPLVTTTPTGFDLQRTVGQPNWPIFHYLSSYGPEVPTQMRLHWHITAADAPIDLWYTLAEGAAYTRVDIGNTPDSSGVVEFDVPRDTTYIAWYASPLLDVDAHIQVDIGVRMPLPFDGLLWWPYLELGTMGLSRMMIGFDLVGRGEVNVGFGFDQHDPSLVTPEYMLEAETLVGGIIPMPIAGPSFQMRLRFSARQYWEWSAAVLYLQDQRATA